MRRKRELAQRGQIAGGEEILGRAPRRLGHIDLALLQALDELVGRDVDEHDVVGLLEHPVGHGLAHGDAGDARDDVGEAFEMLDVERGPDVDAGRDQLLDVLLALGMAAFGRVGVSELVDDDQLGLARQRGVDVEFLDDAAAVVDDAARQDLEPSSSAPVSARPWVSTRPTTTSTPSSLSRRALEQHGVGLADAGRGAEEDLQLAARLPLERRQQRVRIRASIVGSARWGHRQLDRAITTTLA